MNVALHSVFGSLYLFCTAFVCGIALSLVYAILINLLNINFAVCCKRFPSYKEFYLLAESRPSPRPAIFAADYVICLLFSSLILCITFVLNSGNFRVLSPVLMVFGFLLGSRLLANGVRMLFILMLFLLKWIINVVSFPFVWICQKIANLLAKAVKSIRLSGNKKLINKYTASRFSRIDKDAEYGLLDDYYKELLK